MTVPQHIASYLKNHPKCPRCRGKLVGVLHAHGRGVRPHVRCADLKCSFFVPLLQMKGEERISRTPLVK